MLTKKGFTRLRKAVLVLGLVDRVVYGACHSAGKMSQCQGSKSLNILSIEQNYSNAKYLNLTLVGTI